MTPFVYAQISILHLFCEAVVHTNIHRDTLETVLYPPRIGISELHVPCVSPSSSADRLAIALPPVLWINKESSPKGHKVKLCLSRHLWPPLAWHS